MTTQKYNVTCLKCKRSAKINVIDETKMMFIDHVPILAARFRGDLKFGFECMCGNDSRIAREEKDDIEMLVVTSDPMVKETAVKRLADSLLIEDKLKFRMEPV